MLSFDPKVGVAQKRAIEGLIKPLHFGLLKSFALQLQCLLPLSGTAH